MKKNYPITIGGKVYQFRYTFDALTTIEDLCGKSFASVLNESDLRTWKIVFFAGLNANHPDIKVENIGDLIDEADNLGHLTAAVQAAPLNTLGIQKNTEPAAKKKAPSVTKMAA